MDELAIKVKLGNRQYPMTVERDDEEYVRRAADEINENIERLEAKYAVRDKQDLLAMTALQYAKKMLDKRAGTVDDKFLTERISAMADTISAHLQSSS